MRLTRPGYNSFSRTLSVRGADNGVDAVRGVADAKTTRCVIGDVGGDGAELTDCVSDTDRTCVLIFGSRGVEPFSAEMASNFEITMISVGQEFAHSDSNCLPWLASPAAILAGTAAAQESALERRRRQTSSRG